MRRLSGFSFWFALFLLAALCVAADEIELLNGQKLRGKVVEQNPNYVVFKVDVGGGASAETRVKIEDICTILTAAGLQKVNEKPAAELPATKPKDPPKPDPAKQPDDKPNANAPVVRTQAEVDALIDQVGKTPPDWWAGVPVNYPKTLDLSWPQPPPPPWNPQKNVGQYLWDIVHPNPGKWREGVRFIHQILTIDKDNPAVVQRAMDTLGRMYHDLLQDWARAAFWWRKAGVENQVSGATIELAHCYWMLGCREMAEAILNKAGADFTRSGSVIRLWAELGEVDKALKLAEARAGSDPDVGFLAAGDVCRLASRYPEAIVDYQKVVDATAGSRDLPRNKDRAKASLEAVRLFDLLDLKKVRNGLYKDSSLGYEAPVEVEVNVQNGKIVDVKVTQHREKQFYSSITDTPPRIIAKQGVKGVDTTASATITSEAIINATAKALAAGMGNKK